MSKITTIIRAALVFKTCHCNSQLWSGHKAALTKLYNEMRGLTLNIAQNQTMKILDFELNLSASDSRVSVITAKVQYLYDGSLYCEKNIVITIDNESKYRYGGHRIEVYGANDTNSDKFVLEIKGTWRNQETMVALRDYLCQ